MSNNIVTLKPRNCTIRQITYEFLQIIQL